MKESKFILSADETKTMHALGDFIRNDQSSGDIKILIAGKVSVVLKSGQQVKLARFDEFDVIDLTGSANTVTLIVGFGGFDDATLSGNVRTETPNVLQDQSDITIGSNSAQLLIAASETRKEVFITSSAGNVETRLGSSGVTASRGIPIAAGATLILDSGAAVYAFSAGQTATYSVVEVGY